MIIVDSIGGNAECAKKSQISGTLKETHYKNPPILCYPVSAAGFKAGQGEKAGGIGWQEEIAPTLAAAPSGMNQAPTVCAVYRKGTRPHSADEAQKWEEADVANTINTFDVGEARANELVVMCYDARGNGDGKTAPTITGDHNNRVTDYTALTLEPVYCLQGNGIDRSETAGCNGKGWKEDICYTLNTIDRPAVVYSIGNGQPNSLRMEEIAKPLDCMHDAQAVLIANIIYIVRRLTPTECARLQGFADRWGVPDHKDDFSDAESRFWLEVRDTYAEINGKPQKQYTKAQLLKWYNGLYTDSAEYKMWGNGIALPTALYVMQGIEEALRED